MMICFPNAKINLGLNILGKRIDGFHEIETGLYPIPLFDVLEITESDRFRLFTYGYDLGISDTDNLVYKTWQLLNDNLSVPPIEVHLIKNIPAGYGLGGGSSDAAFLIKTINEFFSLKLSKTEMQKLAIRLGSDCAFFIKNEPSFASGRGEILESSGLSLKGSYLVLVFPEVRLSTIDAYKLVHGSKPKTTIKKIIGLPVEVWNKNLINDFEKPIFHKYPAIAASKERLYMSGAIYASLTGSGSCVYGLYKSEPKLNPSAFKTFYKILQL